MKNLLLAAAAAVSITGCTAPNTNLSTMQLSGATWALLPNYRDIAAKAVAHLPVAEGAALVFSELRNMLGETIFSPKRWYACVAGVKPPAPKPTPKTVPVVTRVTDWIAPPETHGRYDVIVILNDKGHTSLRRTFDSELCHRT
ncbi:hypothetical protein N8D56_19225 [Devosia sp. A8/3-2]|nr:hypothetical protein N8D56_19225 [Devosia sp. A8/3-2]